MKAFDYVIVGAGSAGCVLANRLTEDPKCRVLLLEAGGEDDAPLIKIPGAYLMLQDTKVDWAYRTVPQAHLGGRRIFSPRGRVLGGSSSINYEVYIRGNPRSDGSVMSGTDVMRRQAVPARLTPVPLGMVSDVMKSWPT